MRKKIDARIRTLIENGVQTSHRSFFVIVGDHGRDQVVNLHYMLSKTVVKTRPSVLWCYKKELGFSSHKQKRMRQIKKKIQRGLLDPDKDDPFELFISSTNIRYTYYADTHKILGNTYGMCVLQDFEALSPNMLARTIETVEGGGVVVLLLRTMKSLKQLFTMSMEVHARYRTESHQDVVGRFNERFILSLATCKTCLVVDDELNVLPLSEHSLSITAVPPKSSTALSEADQELQELKDSLADTQPAGALISNAKTIDQAKAVLTFIEAISEKTLRSTVTLTAARGRGKSSALGLAIASAVAYGYEVVLHVTPHPENLKTLFEFVFKGFDALEYQEHIDYELVQSTNPDLNKAIVRVNVFRSHRQTIQYIQPQDVHRLGQAELLVIDEAAAIPLPIVRELLGPYLVFMASTINGYEGTGRSLSLKLIQQLRKQQSATGAAASTSSSAAAASTSISSSARTLRELALETPIRYAAGDPVEKWLNELLCLDVGSVPRSLSSGCPHPKKCDLYYINRDTLFSFHKASESFLQRLMALYVASHYKNSPNDLQLISDAPAHHLFCLLGPVDPSQNALPEVLCVVQVCLEGEISRDVISRSLAQGVRASGDLIPWTISQQYQDNDFGSLSGARVVRIATHPDYMSMGYGARALELLGQYYEGKIQSLDEYEDEPADYIRDNRTRASSQLLLEDLRPRANLPPLLMKLTERRPERLHYLGVSYGLTEQLFRFWQRGGFTPVYLRQTVNELTGEHTCIMLKALDAGDLHTNCPDGWLDTYWTDFRRRFLSLLSFQFKTFAPATARSIFGRPGSSFEDGRVLTKEAADALFTVFDLKRLESYARNLVDYHVILDLIPQLAMEWFQNRIPVQLSPTQAEILLAVGLQHKDVDSLEKELALPSQQILALFNKSMRKLSIFFRNLQEEAVGATIAAPKSKVRQSAVDDAEDDDTFEPLAESLDSELASSASSVKQGLQQKQQAMLELGDMAEYAISGTDADWNKAISSGNVPSAISVKSSRQKRPAPRDDEDNADNDDDVGGKQQRPKHKGGRPDKAGHGKFGGDSKRFRQDSHGRSPKSRK
ncbi:N-acetyltransferase 10 [Capsaspora owczarzaki ATCC 30864]|uniref:RNA cytidine acetyltransferase n=1 Tax=Capsaspora owczarzaki (strain ATCC 30864) TaxID=595528 RepID=A0A0D2WUX5_CAPO3|nr:N-acetyltransferase 10 [Capsaspora owczarzaki ATCC 30864]